MDKADLRVNLINNINMLSAEQFHYLCNTFLTEIYNKEFLNTGINASGAPVGHDVDIVSNDNKIVADVTVDKKCFETISKKMKDDFDHCKDRKPKSKVIVLMGSPSITNTERLKFYAWFTPKAFAKGISIEIYDATRIADQIIRRIKDDTFIKRCSEQLSYLKLMSTLLGSDKTFPPLDEKFEGRTDEKSHVKNLLASQKIIHIYGISGVGKSQFTIFLKDDFIKDYKYLIWIRGDDLKYNTNFEYMSLSRHGEHLNIANLLKTSSVFLCIDSVEKNDKVIREISQMEIGEKSRIIITSQQKSMKNKNIFPYELKGVSRKVFEKIINSSSKWVEKLYKASQGHPIVAALIRDLIEANKIGVQDIDQTIEDLGIIETDSRESLMDKILENHLNVAKEGIEFIDWTEAVSISKKLVTDVLKTINTDKLMDRGFIQDEGNGFFKVHDLVYSSIKRKRLLYEKSYWDQKFIALFSDKKINEKDDYQLSKYHRNILQRIAFASELNKVALYYLISRTDIKNNSELNKYAPIYKDLESTIILPDADYYEVLGIIEYYEVASRFFSRDGNKDKSLELCKEGILFCERYLKEVQGSDFEADVYHHMGKFISFNKDFLRAYRCFEKAMQINNSFPAAQLQAFNTLVNLESLKTKNVEIIELLKQTDKNKFITDILDKANGDPSSVSPTVQFACFKALIRHVFFDDVNALLEKYEELFYNLASDLNSPENTLHLELLAGVGERYIKINDEKFIKQINQVELPALFGEDHMKQYLTAQIFKNLAIKRKEKNYIELAKNYYECVDASKFKRKDFELTHMMDFYNRIEEYEKADKLFEMLQEKEKEKAFACLRRAWTLYGLNKTDEAQAMVTRANDLLKESHLFSAHQKLFEEKRNKIINNEPMDTWNSHGWK